MLSLRFVPRALARAPLRSAVVARPGAALRQLVPRAAFSATTGRATSVAESNAELSAKLDSEIQVEEDLKASEQQPATVKDFLDNTSYQLQDAPGHEIVKLVRSFNDEKITISFSISDVTNYDPFNEDPALDDEDDLPEDSLQSPGQQGSARGKGNSRSAAAEEQLDEDMDEDDMGDGKVAPINLTVVVEKPGKTKGALSIEATAQDGNIVIDNVFFYQDAKLAHVVDPEAAQKRADVYPGPAFASLDEDLQVLMERFLDERGINTAMADFLPDYVDVKEQAEYLRWLGNVKGFVNA